MNGRLIKTWLSLIVILSLTAVLTGGCSLDPFAIPSVEEGNSGQNMIVVGISQLGSESVWRSANTVSIQQAISKEKGFFPIFSNARQKQENQIKAIRGFISQRVDYIVFAPVVEKGWDTILSEAKEAGIPVIVMDRKVSVKDDSLYTALVGTDKEEEGKKAGRWLDEEMIRRGESNQNINIVVLQGTKGSSAALGRTKGFHIIAAEHPNWHILDEMDGDFTTSRGKEVMQMLLRRYPNIDVVIAQNDDMAFGAVEAMNEAGITTGPNGDVILISFDAVYSALEMVRDGIINADVECNPLQGEYVASIIHKLEAGEPIEKINMVDGMIFSQDNVEDYLNTRVY